MKFSELFNGFSCDELISILGPDYHWVRGESWSTPSQIIFFSSIHSPAGHYLAKADDEWMDPWINFPSITPAKSGFRTEVPGLIEYSIYKKIN